MKAYIKSIALIISAILIISFMGVLVSCDNINYTLRTDPEKIEDKTGKMPDEIKSEIQLAYYESNKEYCDSPKQVKGVCYGVFDDTYCLMLTLPGVMYMDATAYVDVAGYTFMFGSVSNTMDVYCNGKFYSLTEAYQNGILDDAEIEELYNFYTETKWGK